MAKEEIERQIDTLEDEYFSCNDIERIADIEYELGNLFDQLNEKSYTTNS